MTQDILLSQRGETAALIRSMDWTKTPLGSPDTWPASLVTILRLMLSSRYSMWLGWGKDLTFFYNDAYAAETLGPKHPSAMGMRFQDVWPEIADTLMPRVEHVLRTGEATWDAGLLLFLERSGKPEETYHTFSYSPAPADEAGHIGGLFCVVVEETERVIGERRLAALQELATAFGQTKTEADVFAATERCLGAHGRDLPFTLTYTFDARDLARRTSRTTIDPEHPAAAATFSPQQADPWRLDALRASGETQMVALDGAGSWPSGPWHLPPTHALVMPLTYQGQGGAAGAFIAALNPLRPFDAGTRSFMELLAGQVSAALSNARAYEEERKRADALADIDRAKTTFFSNVSHEFRTPLTLMLGPTEDALASPERALRGADLETVHRNELRLLKLVNSLLDFARIEAGRVQATYTPTDLAALTTDLASSFRSAVDRAGLVFDVACETLPEPAFVDHDMWEKIVLNLLSNALKFTFDGQIAVKLRWTGDHFELSVRDTGVGIAEEELPRLFERFHRVEGARSRTHEGSGIGLALVAELVRLHGGELHVESAIGKGTTFTISLPRGSAHLPPERIGAARAVEPSASGAAYLAEALRWMGPTSKDEGAPAVTDENAADRARVLVADDNADMREYIVRLLRERWDVEAVSDGRAALASIHRRPPDLVLSDVMMPELDGIGLLRALRTDPALRSIPVILLSARAGEEASASGLDAGANDYIVKPFAARDLVVRVASKIAAARAAREVDALKENLYRHFMQAPFPVAIFRGADHVVELANNVCLAAWGKTRHEALGKPLSEVLPELWSQPFGAYIDQVFRTGVTYEGRGERFRREGEDERPEGGYFTFVYAPLKTASGETEGILMSAFEVTSQVLAHKEAERARDEAQRLAAELAVSSYRLRASQQVAGIGIFDWELATDDTYWSLELYHLLGLEFGSVRPSPEAWTARLFDETDRHVGWQAFEKATAARAPKMEVEVRLRQPDDRFRWIRLSTEIHYDDDGKPVRVLGAVVDIQVHKEAAAARARALEEAERTSRAKDEFLATMSHELRTPLNAMLGWATILRGAQVEPERVSHGLAVIERNARTQARLVDDLLDVSRIISGKLRLAAETVAVAGVVNAAVDVVRPAADAKGIRISVDADAGVGSIIGDPDRLQQILWNLVANAVKFTPAEGRVHVSAKRLADSMSIRVEDSGAGVSSDDLPYIFDRFTQVDSSMTRAHGGLGLGLAIVRHLVEAHGGSVHAVSAGAGQGSTFTVMLPARATFAGEARGPELVLAPAFSPRAPTEKMLAGKTVLVVDDDGDSRDLVRAILENAGAAVLVATSAASGLREIARRSVDVVVSDIGMPEMDGYGFIRALRAAQPGLPALALTAYARREDAEQARKAGFQEHVAKPFDGASLVSSVARLLVKA